jgi:uncharacterized membrane protein YkvA (DUF1232 family)
MRSNPRRAAFTAAAAAAAGSDGPVGLGRRIAAIPALVRDVLLGRYDGLSRRRLLLMVLAGLYIVSPVDLLPEAILTIPGLADDAVVGSWLVAAMLAATGGYSLWRDGRIDSSGAANVVPGVVIPSA